jgi:flavin reductase (DIM6/NTAB) family NADH-FMN oxidoreductase RutF
MIVVTAAAEGGVERDGCLVGFHAQAGIHPPRYVVWLSVANRTYRVARRSSHLAVHTLGVQDHDLADHFGGQTEDDPAVDKLHELEWSPGPGGVPLVNALPVRFVGAIVGHLEAPAADHVGFVLEPLDAPTAAAGGAGVDVVTVAPSPPLRLADVGDVHPGHSA